MKDNDPKTMEATRTLPRQNRGSIPSDVMGSYTGSPLDPEYPVPEQDADDL